MSWLLRDEVLEPVQAYAELCREAGYTPASVALAWVLRNQNVSSAIVGASRPEQIAENVKALDVVLEPDFVAAIEKVLEPTTLFDPGFTISPRDPALTAWSWPWHADPGLTFRPDVVEARGEGAQRQRRVGAVLLEHPDIARCVRCANPRPSCGSGRRRTRCPAISRSADGMMTRSCRYQVPVGRGGRGEGDLGVMPVVLGDDARARPGPRCSQATMAARPSSTRLAVLVGRGRVLGQQRPQVVELLEVQRAEVGVLQATDGLELDGGVHGCTPSFLGPRRPRPGYSAADLAAGTRRGQHAGVPRAPADRRLRGLRRRRGPPSAGPGRAVAHPARPLVPPRRRRPARRASAGLAPTGKSRRSPG